MIVKHRITKLDSSDPRGADVSDSNFLVMNVTDPSRPHPPTDRAVRASANASAAKRRTRKEVSDRGSRGFYTNPIWNKAAQINLRYPRCYRRNPSRFAKIFSRGQLGRKITLGRLVIR